MQYSHCITVDVETDSLHIEGMCPFIIQNTHPPLPPLVWISWRTARWRTRTLNQERSRTLRCRGRTSTLRRSRMSTLCRGRMRTLGRLLAPVSTTSFPVLSIFQPAGDHRINILIWRARRPWIASNWLYNHIDKELSILS